ncbi:MAG: hypothetical protein DRI89_00425 [Bacteroidetes bacterium]|nr:MAG: hypothetical protein DRI89_00425 [Bacteroidota bacterium]
MLNKIILLILLFVSAQAAVHAQKGNITLSGFISDKSDGEHLPGATVLIKNINKGAASNTYGFYSISLPANKYQIVYSFIGYANVVIDMELSRDTTINIELGTASKRLEEVEITEQAHENVTSNQMSVNTLTSKTIQSIPMLMGEVDIIKALQLLPGVKFVAEGSSGFSVRGGSPDQNLVQLDEATVYNAGHLMGFFSVFNNDAVKSVQLYKGDLPAQYGGRLSSLVDVRMKEGNNKKFHGNGGIGLIASRLTLEGPIAKNKASFMVSGRRTYADLFLRLSKDENMKQSALYFYDMNAKVNWSINQNNHVFLSGYFGKDVLKSGQFNMNWGNATGTLRWNHIFHEKLFSNFTLVANRFNYSLGIPEPNVQAFVWESDLTDYTLKGDFTWYANTNNTVRFGISSIYHNFYPGKVEGLGDTTTFGTYSIPNNYSLESGIYISNNQKLGSLLTLKYGLRLSMFNNIGPDTVFTYNEFGDTTGYTPQPDRKIYNTYLGFEPRLGIVIKLNEVSSIKASYSRNFQYIQQAENSTGGSPLSIWFPASMNVKPQIGNQFALGYFRNFKKGLLETSVEGYYKNVKNAIDFKDHAELLLNKFIEGELLFGKGWSYGVEFLVKKTRGNLSGWVSYTWSRTLQQIEGISNGDPYPASYDRPHDFSIVMNYNLGEQISFGATWVYLTGQPITFPVGRYVYGNTVVPVYSERNSYRMVDYHRLDVSVTWHDKDKPGKKWHNSLNFSIYNVYNRKNPWVINFQSDPNDPNITYAEVTYLFGIIPSITYNFRF